MSARYQQAEEELEGFEQANQDNQDNFIIVKNFEETDQTPNSNHQKHHSKGKARFLIKEKPKIKFTALQKLPLTSRKKGDSQKCIKSMSLQKTTFEESSNTQLPPQVPSTQTGRQGRTRSVENLIDTIMKTKRGQVGEDLIIRSDENQQMHKMKQVLPPGRTNTIVFKKRPPKGTHELFSQIAKYASSSFLASKYNTLLRNRMEKYQLKVEEPAAKFVGDVTFESGGESCNLQCVGKDSSGEYNLMLSVDTNTRGHQSWFYFTVTNNKPEKQTIVLNICNIRRKFPMVKKGQGVYRRNIGKNWYLIKEVSVETTENGKNRLSFQLQLSQSERVEVSLLPTYTYSDQLKQVESYEQFPNARVEILTYSLAGLAIPMVTITKGAKSSTRPRKNRTLHLITARIHPSETCGSFIVNSLIRELLNNGQYEEFLKQNVLKIVPMVNPDGVVFGNFRTNYLGADLNRSFHCSDEALFPQIVAVKELGRKCKQEYGCNFMGLLDFHGHSSQPNSFIYGPEYPPTSENYIECRIFPKILDRVSGFFHYDSSSFKLQEYKNNTARGFFFRKLKVPAYTIETSYALYCPKESNKEKSYLPFGVDEWQQFGRTVASAMKINQECLILSQTGKGENGQKLTKRRAESNQKSQQASLFTKLAQSKAIYAKLKRDIIQEIKNQHEDEKNHPKQNVRTSPSEQTNQGESDGEGEEEDLSPQEKKFIIKGLTKTVRGRSILPRVSKDPTVASSLPPSIIPTFYIGNDARQGILQRINSKFRNFRHNRPVNISQEYTEYLLRNITGITSMRPEVVSFNPKIIKPSFPKTGEV